MGQSGPESFEEVPLGLGCGTLEEFSPAAPSEKRPADTPGRNEEAGVLGGF